MYNEENNKSRRKPYVCTCVILDSNLKAILDAGFEACFGGALARYFSAPGRTEIGPSYNVRVATSDSLVQLGALRSGVLRMSARELEEELQRTKEEMKGHYHSKA